MIDQQQIEYLDYVRPKRSNKKERAVREVKIQPYRLQQSNEPIQKTNIIEPIQIKQKILIKQKKQLNLSIIVSLSKLKIIVKIGKAQEQKADAILLPYFGSQLNSYLCSLFKEELAPDQQKIKSVQLNPGELYLKGRKIKQYKFRAFVKIESKETSSKDILEGIASLFNLVVQKNIQVHTIALIYTQEIFDLEKILQSLIAFQGKAQRQFTIILIVRNKQVLGKAWQILY